jgi:hypothetical protein
MQCESIGLTTNAGQFASACKNLINRKFTREVVRHRPVLQVQYNSHHWSSPVSRDTGTRAIVRGYSRRLRLALERSPRAREYRLSVELSRREPARSGRTMRHIHLNFMEKKVPTRWSVCLRFGHSYQFFKVGNFSFSVVISVFRVSAGRPLVRPHARLASHEDLARAGLAPRRAHGTRS